MRSRIKKGVMGPRGEDDFQGLSGPDLLAFGRQATKQLELMRTDPRHYHVFATQLYKSEYLHSLGRLADDDLECLRRTCEHLAELLH